MKRITLALLALTTLALFTASCAGSKANRKGVIPRRIGPPAQPELTLVWVGFGEAERFDDGKWQRTPEFDYEFTVEQRRYSDRWESVKHLRRRHPEYDGSAGPRELTYFFQLDLGATAADGQIPLQITSTLGPGEGRTDREFRSATLTFHPDVSMFAPFDTYRIAQTYDYQRGALEETVHLDDGAKPWVRNHEKAALFAAHSFAEPPTRR